MLNLNPLARSFQYSFDIFVSMWMALVLMTNLPLFYDYFSNTTYAPWYYIATIIMAIIYFLMAPWRSLSFFKEPFVILCLFFLIVLILNLLRLENSDSPIFTYEEQFDRFERVAMLPAIAFLCWRTNASALWKILPIACLLIVIGNVYDLLAPGAMGPVGEDIKSGRADGFFRNPNPAAEAALLSVLVLRNHCPKYLFLILYALVGLGIVATFSRSGMMIWFLIGFYMSFSGKLPRLFLAIPVLALLSLNIFYDQIDTLLSSIPEYQYKTDRMLSRLTFVTDTFEGGADEDTSETNRGEIALSTLVAALEKPVFGHGYEYIDSTNDLRPHNQILSLFHSYGVAGILIWLGIVYCLWKEESRRHGIFCLITFVFVWFSFFSHTIIESVFWYLPICIALFSERENRYSGRFVLGNKLNILGHRIDDGSSKKRRRRKRRRSSAKKYRY